MQFSMRQDWSFPACARSSMRPESRSGTLASFFHRLYEMAKWSAVRAFELECVDIPMSFWRRIQWLVVTNLQLVKLNVRFTGIAQIAGFKGRKCHDSLLLISNLTMKR